MRNIRFKENCTHYITMRDRYGDNKLTSLGTIACLYRDVTQMGESGFRAEMNISGEFWLAPSASVSENDLLGYNGKLYQIIEVVTAKSLLTTNAIQFYRCQVSLYRAIS